MSDSTQFSTLHTPGPESLRKRHRAEWVAWQNMKSVCLNPKHRQWEKFGGRGITTCGQWLQSFSTFLQDIGPRPSPKHRLSRCDLSKGFEPGNTSWELHSAWGVLKRSRPGLSREQLLLLSAAAKSIRVRPSELRRIVEAGLVSWEQLAQFLQSIPVPEHRA